jgi:NAD(P)-dependent dehydrogenase (short-subunit alcohol dehydrogenase family)
MSAEHTAPETWLITGASRGIGYEFGRQLLAQGRKVILAARNTSSAEALQALAREYPSTALVVSLDVTSKDSAEAAFRELTDTHGVSKIDVLVNNAGLLEVAPASALSPETLSTSITINVLGPLLVTQVFLPLLKAASNARAILLSTVLASNEHIKTDYRVPCAPYSISKAAATMLWTQFSIDEAAQGITFVSIHPGWVDTGTWGAWSARVLTHAALLVRYGEVCWKPSSQAAGVSGRHDKRDRRC